MPTSDPCPILADCKADLDAFLAEADPVPAQGFDPLDVPTFDLESAALDETSTADLSFFLPPVEMAPE